MLPGDCSTCITRDRRAQRDREKFARMLDFAARLPVLRARVSEDLADEGLGRERLLACAIRLLDRGFFRVGGESYADENGTFGLATLQRRHVRVSADGAMLFSYPAKGGQLRRLRSWTTKSLQCCDI